MRTIKNLDARKAVLYAAVAVLFVACGPPGPRALLEGKKLLDRGKYPEAVEKLKTATSLLATNAQAWNYLGLAYHFSSRPEEAAKAYQRALSYDHDLAEAHYNLGCLQLSENKLDAAKSELTAYTLRRSKSVEGFIRLGDAHLRSRELAPAEKCYNDALRLSAQNPEALTGLGLVRVQRNRPAEAAEYFRSAQKQQADYAPAILNLAILAQGPLNDKALALQKYREYLAVKPVPENAPAVKLIVDQLEGRPTVVAQATTAPKPAKTAPDLRFDAPSSPSPGSSRPVSSPKSEASATPPSVTFPPAKAPAPTLAETTPKLQPAEPLRTSTSRTPSNPVARPKLETAQAPAPKAPALAAKAPQTNTAKSTPVPEAPTHVEVVNLGAEPVIKAAQDPVLTSTEVRTNTAEQPKSTLVTMTSTEAKAPRKNLFKRLFGSDEKPAVRTTPLAQPPSSSAAAGTSETPLAPSSIQRYAYKSPSKPQAGNHSEATVAFAQGLQAQQAHKLSEAVQNYRRATQLDPAYFDAYYNLGLAASETGNSPLALSAYESALAIKPSSVDARYNFGFVLRQSSYYLDAAVEWEKIVASSPNDSRAHLALGNLYAQELKQPAKARAHYLKVLETDPRNPRASAIHYWLSDNPK